MPSIPNFAVYVFDIDGTLTHSAPDICGAISTVLADTACHDVEHTFLQRYIGRHLTDLFQDLFPEADQAEFDRLVASYRTTYRAREHAGTTLYPGVEETIRQLRGRKGTATTKATSTAEAVLDKFGLRAYFDHVQGTDGFPAKPAPDVIYKALNGLGARPDECLFVGDSVPDMLAGRAAGLTLCAVRYGYGDPAELAACQPDYWIDDPRELLTAV